MRDKIQLIKTEMRPIAVPDGTLSLVRFSDFVPAYTEVVRRFLKDNENLGNPWIESASKKLLIYENKGGLVAQSNSYAEVLTASLIPMVTYNQMRRGCEKAGTQNPFGEIYIDLGFNINGNPQTNEAQAKYLLEQMKTRGIKVKNPRGFSFNQLELKASPEAGLVFGIREEVEEDGNNSPENLEPSKFYSFGKNGLFRVYLNCDGYWFAYVDGLASSNDVGRVVRYDAEGVAPKKLEVSQTKENLADRLVCDYQKRAGI